MCKTLNMYMQVYSEGLACGFYNLIGEELHDIHLWLEANCFSIAFIRIRKDLLYKTEFPVSLF